MHIQDVTVTAKYSETELKQLVCHRVTFPEGDSMSPWTQMLIHSNIAYTELPLPPPPRKKKGNMT